jgi:hypothetical protein
MEYDAPAIAVLDQDVIKPRWFAWIDILGDEIAATTGPVDRTFSGTGDSDLDGRTFSAWHPELVEVSEVRHQEGGAATVTASLSGMILPNAELLAVIADPINWRGRPARFWQQIHDRTGVAAGAVVPYHGGFISSLEISGSPEQQTIDLTIENFIASMSRASGRTYLSQKEFDPDDDSAAAAIAIANGNKNFGGSVGSASGGSFGGGDGGAGGGKFSLPAILK